MDFIILISDLPFLNKKLIGLPILYISWVVKSHVIFNHIYVARFDVNTIFPGIMYRDTNKTV